MLGGDGGLGSPLPWALAPARGARLAVVAGGSRRSAAGAAARRTADPALAGVPLRSRGSASGTRDGFRGGERPVVPRGARPGARPARAQRRGQDHHAAHADGADRARRAADPRLRPPGARPARRCCPGSARSSRARASCRTCRGARTWSCTGAPPAGRRRTPTSTRRWRSPASATTLHRAGQDLLQGMRQRLAIAQAMLGLPDLLVLDEPTNGLDPPQIREMREVLGRYAATGRTVIVSSHLLPRSSRPATTSWSCTRAGWSRRARSRSWSGSATSLVVDVDQPGARRRGRGLARRRPRRGDHTDGDHPEARRHAAQRAGAGARGRGARRRPHRAAAGPRRGLPGAGGGGLMPTQGHAHRPCDARRSRDRFAAGARGRGHGGRDRLRAGAHPPAAHRGGPAVGAPAHPAHPGLPRGPAVPAGRGVRAGQRQQPAGRPGLRRPRHRRRRQLHPVHALRGHRLPARGRVRAVRRRHRRQRGELVEPALPAGRAGAAQPAAAPEAARRARFLRVRAGAAARVAYLVGGVFYGWGPARTPARHELRHRRGPGAARAGRRRTSR